LAALFGIEREAAALRARHNALAPLYTVKRLFVQRKAMHRIKPAEAETLDGPALAAALEERFGEPMSELVFATHVTAWLDDEAQHAEALDLALRYAAWAASSTAGRALHAAGVLFKSPHKLDPQRLVPAEAATARGFTEYRLPAEQLRRR